MDFEWDDAKRLGNLAKHGIDFIDLLPAWGKPVVDPIAQRATGSEWRNIALVIIGPDSIVVAVVYTVRGGTKRIISARRARRNERKIYQDRFHHGS